MTRRGYPGVYPYTVGERTLYRALFRDSAGRQRSKRGFTSPTAAAKYRAHMMGKADRGELRTTREKFVDWSTTGCAAITAPGRGTRADYRRHGELRLKPFFGPMRLSAIRVRTVKDFVAEMVERVEAGELAPKTRQQCADLPEYVHQGGGRKVIRVYRQRTAEGIDHTTSRRFRSVSVGDLCWRCSATYTRSRPSFEPTTSDRDTSSSCPSADEGPTRAATPPAEG